MRNKLLTLSFAMASIVLALAVAPVAARAADGVSMYRLYNQWTGEHFYTADGGERDSLVSVGWTDEGVGWTAPSTGDEVHRLYNSYVPGGDHHYTLSTEERDALVEFGWKYEGVSWHSADPKAKNAVPLYRQYNPYATTGTHNYTADANENDTLVGLGWKEEGVAWYGIEEGSLEHAVDFFDYVEENEGNDHGYIAKAVIDKDNPDGVAGWYILNTGTSMDDGRVFADYTHIGSATDATALKNMYVALDIIEECNRLRATYHNLPELKVSDTAMAIGMLNANWSSAYYELTGYLGHAAAYGENYYWGENIAYGHGSVEAAFEGWYWQEKANYTGKSVTNPETGKVYAPQAGGETGHYTSIIDSSAKVTGAGYSMNAGTPFFSQEFKRQNSIPGPSLGGLVDRELSEDLYTVDEYRARLDAAVKALS